MTNGDAAAPTVVTSECRWVDGPEPGRASALMADPTGITWGLAGIPNHTVIAWETINSLFFFDRKGAQAGAGHAVAFGLAGYLKRKRTVVGTIQVTADRTYTFEVEKATADQLRAKLGPLAVVRSIAVG